MADRNNNIDKNKQTEINDIQIGSNKQYDKRKDIVYNNPSDYGITFTSGGTGTCLGNVYGSYVHGIFDRKEIAEHIVDTLAKNKGVVLEKTEILDYKAYKETQYDRLAEILRKHLDMEAVYEMLREVKYMEQP